MSYELNTAEHTTLLTALDGYIASAKRQLNTTRSPRLLDVYRDEYNDALLLRTTLLTGDYTGPLYKPTIVKK